MIHIRRFGVLALCTFLVFAFICGQISRVWAGEEFCDKELQVEPDDPLAYQVRDDRCEGRYLDRGPGSTVFLSSLIESFEDYDLQAQQDLLIEWIAPTAQQIELRVNALHPRHHYRMDTIRPPENNSYRWPIGMLHSLEISRNDIGALAWARYKMNAEIRKIYLPLRIGQQAEPGPSPAYHIVIWPEGELSEMYVSLATVTADGFADIFLWDGKPLEYGYYPAKRGIEFSIPKTELEEAGIYYLEIGAVLRKGGVTTIEYWFYHAE